MASALSADGGGGTLQADSSIKLNAQAALIILCFIGFFFLTGLTAIIYVRQCADRRIALNFTDSDTTGSRRRRRRTATRGLDPDFIHAFPTFLYSDVKGLKLGKSALECVVCLNEFEDHETLRLLPTCCHVFHPHCIDAWLASHVTCPVCRTNLIPTDAEQGRITILSHNPVTDSACPDMEITHALPDDPNPAQSPTRNDPPKRQRFPGIFSRSHTTGHCDSLLRPGENYERFTLRLPEDERLRLVNAGLISCAQLPAERSWRKGYRSTSGGTGSGRANGNLGYYERFDREDTTDRWGLTPSGGVGEELTAIPKSLFRSVKAPVGHLFSGADEIGERSFNKLMQPVQYPQT